MLERDLCRKHKGDSSFQSKHFLFNIALFCNTSRLFDVVTRQLQTATSGEAKRVQVGTVLLLRMAGSPREEERPGLSGAAAIAARLREGFPALYVRKMPFTGRGTYRAVLSRGELSIIGKQVIEDIASLDLVESIAALCAHIKMSVKRAGDNRRTELAAMRQREGKEVDNTRRELDFHSVQIACDLFTLGVVKLADNGADCPLATGSEDGITHVQRWEDPRATVKSLSEQSGREPHEVQTSLCEYNKYTKWWNGAENPKPRFRQGTAKRVSQPGKLPS